MQAVILAAGMGKRLGDLTRYSTKYMVKVNGKRLIEHALDALLAAGIRHVVMVVGHGASVHIFQQIVALSLPLGSHDLRQP